MPLGDEWSGFHRDIIGRDPRVTFPLQRLMHNGGSVVLRQWAEILRTCANELEALSQINDRAERSALFAAAWHIRSMNAKLQRKDRK